MYRNIANALPIVQLPTDLQESLEASAADLWNLCSSLSTHASSTYSIKLFSVLLLSIYELLNPNIDRCLTNVSCLVILFSNSITKDIKDVAKKCHTYVEPMVSKLVELDRDSPFDLRKKKLLQEYREKLIMLNLNYAVISNDIVLARTYEQNWQAIATGLVEPSFVLECSRILYNSSLSQYQKDGYDNARFLVLIAIKYLEGIDLASDTYNQRYLNCYILLVKCYKAIDTNQTKLQAKEALTVLQKRFPGSLEIYHLYFDVCDGDNKLELEDMLMQLVTSVDVSQHFDRTIELLKQCINQSFRGVNKCLDYLLTHFSSNPTLSETLVVTKFVINVALCKNAPPEQTLSELAQFVQVAERTLQSQLSLTAKSSVIAIVWSQGMKDYKLANYQESIKWLQLALSRLFYVEYSENQDRGKILRAIQNNNFELGNYSEVIATAELMDHEDKVAVLTQFNMFRSYLMLHEEDKAMECICRLTEHDDPLAILTTAACILESKDKLSPSYVRTIFLKLVEYMCEFDFTEEYLAKLQEYDIVFPACCRCAVVMFNNEFEKDGGMDESLLGSLRELLQKSCEVATKLARANVKIFTTNDLEWLASKSYNIALACQEQGKVLGIASEFCKISVAFIDLISPQIEVARYQQLVLWKIRASLLNVMFTCSNYKLNSNEWNEVREKCLELKELIQKQNCTSEVEWKQCLQQATVFHFQAELSLGSVQNLFMLVEECSAFKSKIANEMFNVFVTLIMDTQRSVSNHTRKQLLKMIIDKTLNSTQSSSSQSQLKMAITWMRHLFESCEQNFGDSEKSLLLQLYKLIKANKPEITIPSFEIEWLATTCWNFGIVSIIDNGKLTTGVEWCSIGVILSRFVHERLQQQLQIIWNELVLEQHISSRLLEAEISKYE
ncbi:Sporulation-specific protein 22 [Candida viswanathii]|uniref:Sporulation-specific protein 22 n=1 Tax=Candida viswanathii TaxID=5486 RepID=A0A367Y6K9_9ASCO|nr:Sporulation-specific protein 22 [Candida viswanathii]